MKRGAWAYLVGTMLLCSPLGGEEPSAWRERAKNLEVKTPSTGTDRLAEGGKWIDYAPFPAVPTTLLGQRGVFPAAEYYGNYFDSRSGKPLASGQVTIVSWYQGVAQGSFLVGMGPPGTRAVQQIGIAGAASFAFNSVEVDWSSDPPFWAGVAIYGGGSIGAVDSSRVGQGFHAMVVGGCYPSSQCPSGPQRGALQRGFYPYTLRIASLNAQVAIRGGFVIPVELLEFELD